MKRLILALGIGASALAISTPASAQTGCRWYDVNCRLATGDVRRTDGDVRRTDGTVDSSWRVVGRDANGNTIYERRRVDGNGNVVIERARRDGLGRMVIINRDINAGNNRNVLNSSRRYERNGMVCSYKENSKGYEEKCRYAKNKAGKLYQVNRDGVYRDGVYRTNTVNGDKYNKAVQKQSNKYNKAVQKQSNKYNKAVEKQSKQYYKANGKDKHDKH